MKISRLNSIEQYVIAKETATIDELCEAFGVSKNTIRRDLNELEARGHIAKVYGGVTAVSSAGAVPMPVRSGLHPADKTQIGRLAAEEVSDGDTIFIDSGTTTVCMLKFLAAKKRITVVTHSLGALAEASKYENLSVISLGGIYSRPTDSFVGLSAFESLSAMKIHKAFMAATGVSLDGGMTNTTFLEAEIKRGVVQRAAQIYLLADASKLDKDAVVSFCTLEKLTGFVTDRKPDSKYMEFFKKHGIRVHYSEEI